MNRGWLGARAFNIELQQALKPLRSLWPSFLEDEFMPVGKGQIQNLGTIAGEPGILTIGKAFNDGRPHGGQGHFAPALCDNNFSDRIFSAMPTI
jgi:hypothetical protein